MALIGYARVSTGEQTLAQQAEALRAAGCARLFSETVSGAARSRPELERALAALGPGDVLVCTRLDRLARSLAHLLEIVAGLQARGIGFRSLADPIDTTSAQGRLALQILGAVAEFERALIRERTRAGLAAARARGRRPGNPALAGPEGRRALARARDHARSARLIAGAGELIPLIARTRPATPWEAVARLAAARGLTRPGDGGPWTRDALIRAARRLVRDRLLDAAVLGRARPGPRVPLLVEMVAALHAALPDPTLSAIARTLERQMVRAPGGGRRWSTSSVRNLLAAARAQGLLRERPG
jgi:DNA invertase Pin-like site-specific DNA recombinase